MQTVHHRNALHVSRRATWRASTPKAQAAHGFFLRYLDRPRYPARCTYMCSPNLVLATSCSLEGLRRSCDGREGQGECESGLSERDLQENSTAIQDVLETACGAEQA